MTTNRWTDRVILAAVLLAVLALGIFTAFSGRFSSGVSLSYQQELFGSGQVMTVEIQMDPDQWQELLDMAVSETYYCCDITVNGESYYRVGIRAKGNTSLSMVAASGSDRYSFKIKFDEYVEGQTCHGLDKLVLNNNYADATMMKEAVVYDMFSFLEVPASLCSYAKISVNGEYWGVYLALEAVEESFALRNYGTHYGKLYKPDSMEVGGPGKMEQVDPDSFSEWLASNQKDPSGLEGGSPAGGDLPQGGQPPDGEEGPPFSQGVLGDFSPERGLFGEMGGSSGRAAALNYVGDELEDYSVIWDSQVFSSKKSDHKRVVQALKNISAGTDLAESMDVDRVLRYLAVQTFVVNLDGLTGSMAHNYYLYEKNGQLSLVPWDYNLAFGGFGSGDAASVVHFPVDTPFSSGVSADDRQFFMAILNREEYREKYHAYLKQLAQEYVNGSRFEAFYQTVRVQLDSLAAADPTAFYTGEEYDTAARMLYRTVQLRAESVLGQLAGEIPATHEEQAQAPSLLFDTSEIDLTVMGVMMGGGFGEERRPKGEESFGGFPGGQRPERPADGSAPAEPAGSNESPSGVPDLDVLPDGEEQTPGPQAEGQGPLQQGEALEQDGEQNLAENPAFSGAIQSGRPSPFLENASLKGSSPSGQKEQTSWSRVKGLSILGGLLLAMGLAVLGAAKYRRR
ncbi:MAG: hypothetical protein HFK04_01265 [Oscillospiraceae bacterium]|nr:hypothetical protein [Oscillospiraceae bacterium]